MKEVLVEGSSRRGRPLGRWKDGVKEYMCKVNVVETSSRSGRTFGRKKE